MSQKGFSSDLVSILKANGTPEIKAAIRQKELELEALYWSEVKARKIAKQKCDQRMFIVWKWLALVVALVVAADAARTGAFTEIGTGCIAVLGGYSLFFAVVYLEIEF